MADIRYKSWGERLVESIKGVLIGIILFIVSFPLLFWNEGRAVDTARALEEGGKSVISVPAADKVDPANEGKLVHLTAEATTQESLEDTEFLIKENAIALERKVEMYQWKQEEHTRREKQLGGGEKEITDYTYEKVWSNEALDSSNYHDSGHSNPATMRLCIWPCHKAGKARLTMSSAAQFLGMVTLLRIVAVEVTRL